MYRCGWILLDVVNVIQLFMYVWIILDVVKLFLQLFAVSHIDRRVEKESLAGYIAKKREMFLVQVSYDQYVDQPYHSLTDRWIFYHCVRIV